MSIFARESICAIMKLIDVLTGLALPKVCACCGRELVVGEDFICLFCRSELRDEPVFDDNARISRLPRQAPIERVVGWMPYIHDNPFCALIRRGKYGGRPDIIEGLAGMFGGILAGGNALRGVDVLVPVGMHWWKRLRRGYNQAEIIASSIGHVAGLPVEEHIVAVRSHRTQARSSAEARSRNVCGIFRPVDAGTLAGRHIGIVDDILTTGATMSEAIKAVAPGNPSAISVYTLAITRQ